MVGSLAQAVWALPVPALGAAIVLMMFVSWVIASERRTRHLTQLIRAWRGSGRRSGARFVRRRVGR